MSITALSSEALTKANISSTSDLARLTTAVTLTLNGNFLQPAIRGVSSTGANVGESANVAVYLDGVYQPQQIATLLDLADVKQVEILKGPQGALYGQNATGGAILVTTNDPSFTANGILSASYGNYNALRLRGYATTPISDAIAISLAGGYEDRDGFRRQVVTRQRDQGLNSKVVRGKILFQPSDNAKIIATAYYSNTFDSAAQSGVPLANNSLGYALIPSAPRVTSTKEFGGSPDVFTRIKSYGGSLRAEIDVGPGTINSITGITRNNIHYLADIDYSPVNFAEALAEPLSGRYFSQELNFVSHDIGRVKFLAGVFYLNGSETFGQNIFQLLAPNLVPAARLPATVYVDSYGRVEKESIAPYAEITWKPFDRVTFTASGRYSIERIRAFANNVLAAPNMNTIVEYPGGSQTFSKFTPRVTATYAINSTNNVYASWGKGFHSGLINTANFAQGPINPENITAYEIGYKGRVAPGLNVSLAGFYYNYRDLQVVAYVPPNYLEQNAASAHIKGIEANGSWRVSRDITFSGGIAYLDARYVKFPNAQIFIPTGFGNNQTTGDLGGQRLPRSPRITGNFAVNLDHQTALGKASLYSSVYYSSRFGLEPTNRISQAGYATVDGELALEPTALPRVRLALWVKNLTDRAYLMSYVVSQFADGGMYAEPRTFGVRGEYRF